MGFPATRHSVIARMQSADAGTRRQAFGDLVEGYWKPLRSYLRLQWRLPDVEAEELTQAFFSNAFEKEWLSHYDTGKARFRTFVRLCADRFVMNARQSAARIKRGGASEMVSLDAGSEVTGAGAIQPSTGADAEERFRQEFVRALFERAFDEVRREYHAAGRQLHLTLFDRYDIDPADDVSYASLAREFGLTSAQVTNALAQIRRRFRTHALRTLQTLCVSDEEFRREAYELFGVSIE